ncbi:Flavin-containing monooxygenase [Balamuthia mandrillaris]
MEKGSKRVAIVGAGWSGLYALKALLHEQPSCHHQVTVFERTDGLGGVWNYDEERPGTVHKSAHTVSSKAYLHASDFPIPKNVSHFPGQEEVLAYLQAYARRFDLLPHIRFRHNVETIHKDHPKNQWTVVFTSAEEEEEDQRREEEQFDCVVVATGQFMVPRYPKDLPPYANFTGQTLHSSEYKSPSAKNLNLRYRYFKQLGDEDKAILIVGGGESASDVAAELCEMTQPGKCFVSIRNGTWFHDRTVGAFQPTDHFFTKHQRSVGLSKYQSWILWIAKYAMVELMWGKGGSGIKAWQPKYPYFHGPINCSRDFIDKIALHKITPKAGVVKTEGNNVWFEGEAEPVHIDLMIFCTGFECSRFPFLMSKEEEADEERKVLKEKDGELRRRRKGKERVEASTERAWKAGISKEETRTRRIPEDAFKLVFDPEDPTLSFVGFARPFMGSAVGLAEMQARWIAAVYNPNNKVKLPTTEEMKEQIKRDKERHKKLFPLHHEKLPHLVNHWEYHDQLAKYIGAKPRLTRWFLRNPLTWWTLVSSPWCAFLYRSEDPNTRDEALQRVASVWEKGHFPFHIHNLMMLGLDFVFVCLCLFVLFVLCRFLLLYSV